MGRSGLGCRQARLRSAWTTRGAGGSAQADGVAGERNRCLLIRILTSDLVLARIAGVNLRQNHWNPRLYQAFVSQTGNG